MPMGSTCHLVEKVPSSGKALLSYCCNAPSREGWYKLIITSGDIMKSWAAVSMLIMQVANWACTA